MYVHTLIVTGGFIVCHHFDTFVTNSEYATRMAMDKGNGQMLKWLFALSYVHTCSSWSRKMVSCQKELGRYAFLSVLNLVSP